jgi:hypothetical protein
MLRIAALAAIIAAVAVPTANAGVTCTTSAAAEIAGATVNGPRAGWDPPVWTFDMPDLKMSVDVQDYTHDGAAAKAQTWLQGQVDGACAVASPAPAPTQPAGTATPAPTSPASNAPAVDQTDAATTLLAAATITYVGNSWGPTPIYEAALPTLNTTIDVAASSADEARSLLVPTVAAMLGGSAAPVTSPAAPITQPTTTGETTTVSTSTTATAATTDAAVRLPGTRGLVQPV